MAEQERLIADIMAAQQRLQRLFAYDRSDPLFSSQLHLDAAQDPHVAVMRRRHVSGSELAGLMGVGLATLSGMIDRLVAQDLVARREDLRDRRVRRIGLTNAGNELIGGIMTAGAEKQRGSQPPIRRGTDDGSEGDGAAGPGGRRRDGGRTAVRRPRVATAPAGPRWSSRRTGSGSARTR